MWRGMEQIGMMGKAQSAMGRCDHRAMKPKRFPVRRHKVARAVPSNFATPSIRRSVLRDLFVPLQEMSSPAAVPATRNQPEAGRIIPTPRSNLPFAQVGIDP